VTRVDRHRLNSAARSEAPQGVLALAEPVTQVDLEGLCAAGPGLATPFLLVLDEVTDPHNLGALLRTASVAGATGVVIPRHRSAHITPTVAKAAAGAIEYIPMSLVQGIPAALSTMTRAGVWTVGLDPGAERSLWDLPVATEAVAVVLGGEGRGLSRLAKDRCEVTVSIPQRGPIESLNVSAAGALACFEIARRRAHKGPAGGVYWGDGSSG
jgi:23S rRNA (guanosine2251-2'-O)-methyltransferase